MLCDNTEGWHGLGGEKEVQEGGAYIYFWLIYVDIWQKPTQYVQQLFSN